MFSLTVPLPIRPICEYLFRLIAIPQTQKNMDFDSCCTVVITALELLLIAIPHMYILDVNVCLSIYYAAVE